MNLKYRQEEKIRDALIASVKQLCRVYWGPSEALCQQMLESSFLEPFDTLASWKETNWVADLSGLQKILDGFSETAPLLDYLEQGYVRLFVNAKGGIAAPLYASCYDEADDSPQLMGKAAVGMQQMLQDLGFAISDDVGEPPDHLAIELEVLYYLLTRHGVSDQKNDLTDASNFASVSMIPWIRSFYGRLKSEDHCRFYPLITAVLLSVLNTVVDMHKGCAACR
jgi:TorA maturation chaperone TorD